MNTDRYPSGENDPTATGSTSDELTGLSSIAGLASGESHPQPLIGSEIGGIQIVRLIAEGGMGRVYEGAQEKPRRTVAVKVMRPGITSPATMRRFEYEAQVLASLQHHGIARIYAVGASDVAGITVPYFVMEYVPHAVSITQYADDHQLSVRERLALFQDACDAVAHGHQKGVIHRDLKPSNILVDATGKPRVIDFGVARTTDPELSHPTALTEVGQLIGTLQYMAPEQFTCSPLELDVRADVYSLGVVLYELLAGRPPLDVHKKPAFEAARIVKEVQPASLVSITPGIPREAGAIAAKCLEKNPERRYAAASELAADIRRCLAGEPITAEPPGLFDGLARLARKHRIAAVSAATALAAIIGAAGLVSFFAVRAERARQNALVERDRANTEASNARRQLYAANLFRLDNMLAIQGGAAARKLLDDTAALQPTTRRPIELRCIEASMDRSILTLRGHSKPVVSMRYGINGSYLATSSQDGTARLWDAMNGESKGRVTGLDESSRSCVAFLDDGTAVVAGRFGDHGQLRDIATGDVRIDFGTSAAPYLEAAFRADGGRVAISTADQPVRIWDTATGKEMATLGHESTGSTLLAFGANGRLATTADQGVVRVWDTETGESVAVLSRHKRSVLTVAFNPDATQLASGAEDNAACLWSVGEEATVVDSKAFDTMVTTAAFSPDGRMMATGSADRSVWLWNLEGDDKRLLRGHINIVSCVAFSPDGQHLASVAYDNTLRIWNTSTNVEEAVLNGHDDRIETVIFSPDGTRLATSSLDNTVRIWDATQPDLARLKGHTKGIRAAAFSPDGSRLVTAGFDNTARLWDVPSGQPLAVLEGHADSIWSVAYSPDGRSVATGSFDKTARLWDTFTGRQLAMVEDPESQAMWVGYRADGTPLAVNGSSTAGTLWNLSTGRPEKRLDGDARRIRSVSFTRNSNLMAAGMTDGRACVWNSMTGEMVCALSPHADSVTCITFSPDGKRVATASNDTTVGIGDVSNTQTSAVLRGHQATVSGVAFSPDGSRVATASWDNTTRIWDATTLSELLTLKSMVRFSPVAFSPDGRFLATGSSPNDVKLWGASNAEIYAARIKALSLEQELKPILDHWFQEGLDEAVTQLESQEATLGSDRFRVARNMVLRRANGLDSPARKPE